MFTPKFFVHVSQPKNQDIADGIKKLLQDAGQQLVNVENEARYVIEVRESGEAAGGSKYSFGGDVTDAAIGDRAFKIGNVTAGNFVGPYATQDVGGNLKI